MYQGTRTKVQLPTRDSVAAHKVSYEINGRAFGRKGPPVPQKIARDAKTGAFIPMATAQRRPSTTTVEFVGSGTSNSRLVNRSADTGRFVTDTAARRSPAQTIRQWI